MDSSVVESCAVELPDNDSPRSPAFASPCASNSAISQVSDSEYFAAKDTVASDLKSDAAAREPPVAEPQTTLISNHVDTEDSNKTVDVSDVTLIEEPLDETVVDAFNNTIMSDADDSDVSGATPSALSSDEQQARPEPCDNEHSGAEGARTPPPNENKLAQAEGATPPSSSKKNKSGGGKKVVKVTTIKRGKGKSILQDMNANTGYENSTGTDKTVPVT